MIDQCTCRSTETERFLNRSCPIHGDAEMYRRHQAARRAARPVEQLTGAELEAEFTELFGNLDPAVQQAIRGVMEGCHHE